VGRHSDGGVTALRHYLHPNITDMGQGSDILAELFG